MSDELGRCGWCGHPLTVELVAEHANVSARTVRRWQAGAGVAAITDGRIVAALTFLRHGPRGVSPAAAPAPRPAVVLEPDAARQPVRRVGRNPRPGTQGRRKRGGGRRA